METEPGMHNTNFDKVEWNWGPLTDTHNRLCHKEVHTYITIKVDSKKILIIFVES